MPGEDEDGTALLDSALDTEMNGEVPVTAESEKAAATAAATAASGNGKSLGLESMKRTWVVSE